MSTKNYVTPPEAARTWGVSHDKVRQLIHSGQIVAINLAVDPHGRPRYRIAIEEIERFTRERSSKPAPIVKRRRRMAATAGKQYF